MKRPLRIAALCLLPALALAADRPDARPGLWEMTRDATFQAPAIPEELLAKLPPEARARLQASAAGGPRSTHKVTKQCVTEKDLDRLYQDDGDRAQHCQRTIVSQTPTGGEVKPNCQDPQHPERAVHGTIKWHLTSQTAALTTIEMSGGTPDHPMNLHSQIAARWLGASCGDVKPGAESE